MAIQISKTLTLSLVGSADSVEPNTVEPDGGKEHRHGCKDDRHDDEHPVPLIGRGLITIPQHEVHGKVAETQANNEFGQLYSSL